MFHSEQRDLGRWAGLAAASILLVLCFSFFGSFAAAADREPVPPPPLSPRATTSGATVLADQRSPDRIPEPEDGPRLTPPYERLTGSGPLAFGPGSSALDALQFAPPLPGSATLAICLTTERVWGLVGASETVTVTVGDSQMGAALADANGFFWTTLYDSAGDRPGLASGDSVSVYHDGSLAASLSLRSISAAVDVVADTVSGSIGGAGLPISVTVYAGMAEQEPTRAAYSRTVSTNGSGEFTAEFSGDWDLAADDAVVVAYLEDGVEVHQRFHGPRLVVLPFPFGIVAGWTTPGAAVTGTVYSDFVGQIIRDQKTLTAGDDGRYEFSGPETGLDLNEGDVVAVEIEAGPVLTRSVDHITPPQVDTANDRVVGEAEAGAVVHGRASSLTPVGYRDVYTTAIANGSGVYTLEFGTLVDLMPGYWGGGYVEDDEGDALMLWAPSPAVEVHQTWDEVRGRAPAPPGPLSIGHAVTLTLNHDGSETSFVKGMDWYGDYYFSPDDGLPDIGPGDVITVESEGYAWQGVVQVQAMSAAHDPDLDQIAGTVELPSSRVEIYASQWRHWSDSMPLYPVGGQVDTLTTSSSPFAVTLEGFDVRNASQYDVGHRTGDSYLEMIYNSVDHVRVWPWYGAVAAQLGPAGTPYTFTVRAGDGTLKAETTGTSGDPTGWTDYWWVSDAGVAIVPGDRVQVESEEGFSQTVVIPDLSLNMEAAEDVVSGAAPANSLLFVQVDNHGAGFAPVGADGDFAVSAGQLQNLWGDGDLGWGDNGFLCYLDEHANQVCRGYDWPHIIAKIGPNSGGDRHVWGYGAAPDATVLVTVTTDLGALVTTTATDSDAYGNYDTEDQLPEGSLELWNDVTVDFGNGMTDTLTIYPMGGEANPDTDVITVTAAGPPFFSVGLQYCDGDWCDWIDMGSIGESGVVTVNLAAERGFDVQAGTHYDAYLSVWNSHEVVYSWLLPIADLWIEKETTPGHAIPGGTYLYKIRYGNGGTGTTESTLITDTLPANTAYQADTSDFPVASGGGVVTWTLDPVPSGSNEEFFVALSVDGSVLPESNLEPNCVSISAASPPERNPGDNHRCSEGAWVTEGDRGIWVDKWPEFNDPHPGQLFFYEINYGSDGGGATGPVWLTDTLPAGTEFAGWQEQNGWGALWTEVITTGGQFVLHAPAGIPGDMGGRIRLALRLDAGVEISSTLVNLVEVVTPEDVNPDNNWDSDDSAHVSPPRHDMWMEKDSNGGVLVPGGEVWFHIRYENRGNVDTQAWLTDTLPAGASYRPGSAGYGGGSWFPFEPAEVTDDLVVWDLGVVEVGQSVDFDFALDIDPGASLGDLENCAEVGVDGTETTPGDNADCAVETLYSPDPNLRVHKWQEWNGDGQLYYQVQFQNIGSDPVSGVWITDVLPLGTYWDGWWELDFDWERLVTWDYVDGARTFLWNFAEMWPGETGWLRFNANLDEPGSPMRWYTNTVEITIPPGDPSPGDNYDETVAFSGGELRRVEFWLNATGPSSMWGEAVPGSAITVTTPVSQVYAWADPECGGCWNIDNADALEPGDLVEVVAGEGLLPVTVTIPAPFSAEVDTVADTVFGQIGSWSERPVEIHGDWPGGYREIQSDLGGNYLASFPDVPRGGSGYVRIFDQVSFAEVIYHRPFAAQDLLLEVNYGHDWIQGFYEPDHTVWITVTESDRVTVKGTAELQSQEVPQWGDFVGFSTSLDDPWDGEAPDMQPGDWVFGRVDNGYASEVKIGDITGAINTTADTIAGTITAPWPPGTLLDAWCSVWVENGPRQDFTVDAAGDPYFCDFTEEWDLQPGQDVAVGYMEPDQDQVMNVFREPAPDLRIEKWADGEPAEGSNFTFHIRYANQGGLPAENTVITDTLEGMLYLDDTSGLPTSGSGAGPIVWDVGTLDPGDWIQFDLFVEISVPASSTITNTAEIATSNPFDQGDPGDKVSGWSGHVVENQTSLNVGKGAWTGDPAPGTELVFEVNPCNNSPTASSQLILTDTLHPSMTLQTWWAGQPGWFEVSSDPHQLVVSHLSLSGWSCNSVYVKLAVDPAAEPGLNITNTATIFAANDLDGDNNVAYWDGWVSEPYHSLYINKQWSWGQLVPGGQLSYDIDFGNNGNLPIGETLRVTDTLPAHTTFREAWLHDNQHMTFPIEPVEVTGEYVVWEVTGIENGYRAGFGILLDVDPGAPLGVLTNTAQITCLPDEGCEDNTAHWVESLYEGGPNLRARKWGSWDDWGSDTRRASYDLRIENVGDARVEDILVRDWYPPEMQMDGGIDTEWWRLLGWGDDAANHIFTATYAYLDPGEGTWINFGAIVPGSGPLDFGLILTNTVEAEGVPGEPTYDDNVYHAVLTTGPDLYVKKELVSGELAPGALVTYSLVFGNDRPGHEGWWNLNGNALLTDTLPAKTEFDSARLRWCGWTEWCDFGPASQNGPEVAWQLWPLGTSERNEIHLTVRVSDTIEAGDLLTNWVEIASDQPDVDVEPNWDNNHDSLEILAVLPQFEVGKVYESSGVAGTDLTYMLTVTNTGNSMGTNVVLTDALPAGLAYGGSDGTHFGDMIAWNLGSIAAEGGWAGAWFSGTLPCEAGQSIVNDDYRVTYSDQAVTSPAGAPVSLETISPTISVALDSGPSYVVVSDTVNLTATVDTNGTALAYEWDFDDGTSGTGLTASHAYTVDGSYTVVFTATDTCGYTKVASIAVEVSPPNLIASFDQSATTVAISTTVHFTDTSTSGMLRVAEGLLAPPIVEWHWDFGDGSQPVTTQNAYHTYLAEGTFTVGLVVTDALGYSDSAEGSVTVNPPQIVADFDYQPKPALILLGQPMVFTDTSTTDGPSLVGRKWEFGDGSTSIAQHPSYEYTQVGTYTVSLAVTDSLGYSDQEVKTDLVVVLPACTPLTSASWTYTPADPLINSPVEFTASFLPLDATEPITYEWDFGDGSTATVTLASVQHTYASGGSKPVKLTVYNPCTPEGVSKERSLLVEPRRIYLPIVLRNQ